MSFRCTIVTPESQALDVTVKQVILPAHDGLMGILTGRAPLLVKLGVGPLTVEPVEGGEQVYFVDGGVAQMKDDVLSIVTGEATPARDLNRAQAEAELASATAAVTGPTLSAESRDRNLQRARAKVALAK